jgi:hypothetical protein
MNGRKLHTGVGYNKVRQPVCGSGNGHGLGAKLEREHFGSHDPSYGTPSRSKKGDEDANENNENLLPCEVFDGDCFTNDGDNIFTKTHANGADKQETASAASCSIPYIPGMVITTLTALVTMAMMKGSRIPEFLKNVMP